MNYWHDMQFDFKYVYYRFMQQLGKKRTLSLTGRRKALSMTLAAQEQEANGEDERAREARNGRA